MNSLCTSVGKFKALSKVKSDTDLKWPVCRPGRKAQVCGAKPTNGRKNKKKKKAVIKDLLAD